MMTTVTLDSYYFILTIVILMKILLFLETGCSISLYFNFLNYNMYRLCYKINRLVLTTAQDKK